MLTPADAARLLLVLDAPIPARGGLSVRLHVAAVGEEATVQLLVFDDQGLRETREQQLALLPPGHAVDEARYEAFVAAVARGLQRADLDTCLPGELLLVDLLRVPTLRTPEAFAEAILDSSVSTPLLAPLQLGDLGQRLGLPALEDRAWVAPLWQLWKEDRFEVLERAVARLPAEPTPAVIGYLLFILEGWLERMAQTGGVSRLTADDKNADVVLARRLHPALRRSAGGAALERLEALEVMGLFDLEHEDGSVTFLYET